MKNCYKLVDFININKKRYYSNDGPDYMDHFNYIWCGVLIEQVSMYHVATTIKENTKL